MRSTRRAAAWGVAVLWGVALATAAADKPNLLKPTNRVDSWRFEQHEQGKGTIKVDGDAICFEVTHPDGEAWHVQAVQNGLDLKDAREYVLTYKAKADPARPISINAMIDQADWHTIGLTEEVELTKDWKDYSHTFKAERPVDNGKNRVSFILGGDKGNVWLKDVTLAEK